MSLCVCESESVVVAAAASVSRSVKKEEADRQIDRQMDERTDNRRRSFFITLKLVAAEQPAIG